MSVAESSAPANGGLRVLTLTTLYPNARAPRHGIFVETRLRELQRRTPVQLRVIAPVPWFPCAWQGFGKYAGYAAVPREEVRHAIPVQHPRYPMVPKIGMRWQPAAVAAAAWRALGCGGNRGGEHCGERGGDRGSERGSERGDPFDVIDAHYLYPDGVAAMLLSARIGKPFVVTARGSDVNLIATMPGPREAILRMARAAAKVITVSDALRRALIAMGVEAYRIETLRNGVDTEFFAPHPQPEVRRELGFPEGPLVVSVGNLAEEKGHDLVLDAAARIPGLQTVIVGEGPLRLALENRARSLGIAERTRFLGNLTQDRLRRVYAAADVLALGSRREGWPNVLLEAMACGTPVVATDVGGVPEIVVDPAAGIVVPTRDPREFADAIARVLGPARAHSRDATRAAACRFSWEPVVHRYFETLATAAAAASIPGSRFCGCQA